MVNFLSYCSKISSKGFCIKNNVSQLLIKTKALRGDQYLNMQKDRHSEWMKFYYKMIKMERIQSYLGNNEQKSEAQWKFNQISRLLPFMDGLKCPIRDVSFIRRDMAPVHLCNISFKTFLNSRLPHLYFPPFCSLPNLCSALLELHASVNLCI